ncbi:MAG TPA: sigma-70 family RNA polymerase sigma factor [Candidatus Limnocylindrales bacterium]|nr:sigma-70 family RNA polymerase sigma factor [Candidatus Limnocylindrales bacterium]
MSERLIERARHGDPDAFVALIEERQAAMSRVATAILGSGADAADAIQDALVAAWRGLPRLRDDGAFDPWLERILVNSCRLAIRRRNHRRVREMSLPPVSGDDGTDLPHPRAGDDLEGIAEREAFDRAFDGLAIDDRAIVVLHHLEGRSLADVGRVLGIPVGTAKSRLFHARRRLDLALRAESDG